MFHFEFENITMFVLQDCFFVSVVIRNNPELQNKPVAVCHSDNPRGTAEISSANYPARAYGWYCYEYISSCIEHIEVTFLCH